MKRVELKAIEKAGNYRNQLMLITFVHVFLAIVVTLLTLNENIKGRYFLEIFHLYWPLLIVSFAFSLIGNFLPKIATVLQLLTATYILSITTRYIVEFELSIYLLFNSYSCSLAFSAWFALFRKQMFTLKTPNTKTVNSDADTNQNRGLRKKIRRENIRSKLSTNLKSTGYRG